MNHMGKICGALRFSALWAIVGTLNAKASPLDGVSWNSTNVASSSVVSESNDRDIMSIFDFESASAEATQLMSIFGFDSEPSASVEATQTMSIFELHSGLSASTQVTTAFTSTILLHETASLQVGSVPGLDTSSDAVLADITSFIPSSVQDTVSSASPKAVSSPNPSLLTPESEGASGTLSVSYISSSIDSATIGAILAQSLLPAELVESSILEPTAPVFSLIPTVNEILAPIATSLSFSQYSLEEMEAPTTTDAIELAVTSVTQDIQSAVITPAAELPIPQPSSGVTVDLSRFLLPGDTFSIFSQTIDVGEVSFTLEESTIPLVEDAPLEIAAESSDSSSSTLTGNLASVLPDGSAIVITDESTNTPVTIKGALVRTAGHRTNADRTLVTLNGTPLPLAIGDEATVVVWASDGSFSTAVGEVIAFVSGGGAVVVASEDGTPATTTGLVIGVPTSTASPEPGVVTPTAAITLTPSSEIPVAPYPTVQMGVGSRIVLPLNHGLVALVGFWMGLLVMV